MTQNIQIRPAESRDLEAVYSICLKTGDAGRDATALYRDPKLVGHIYAAPYVALDGAVSHVAEDDLGVLGYAVGATDTRAFEQRLERDWWPALRLQYPEVADSAVGEMQDALRIRSIHHPVPAPDDIVCRFPAHIHMNLLPRARGKGVGSRLLEAWLAQARSRNATAVHAGVSAVNKAGLAFWTARGFEPVLEAPESGSRGTIWCGRQV
ncbi:GNAT family N-acetyltransferase [Labrenzia sp. VG12]|uniref:GNAT family N-acetyltransferase n=1 Tax=Labrenzia sp. VG12 TaxID=2021862 RepID=UPI000B8BCACA|nr:GNAT family N-acetyltransferase [Labrenzia sp. VG12]ASP36365.1 GNAT family N-acetyltransferase [Labrenzia sp. VG12]